jgi:5-formyltetrahydrofolate cyclo-ligase
MLKNNADTLRMRLRELRKTIPLDQRQRHSNLLCAQIRYWFSQRGEPTLRGRVVAGFWPLVDEPDIRPLLVWLHEQGAHVALPAVAGQGIALEFHRWMPSDSLSEGAFGVLEPARNRPLIPDVVLVPTLGFGPCAERLGYGGGYYDRSLAALFKDNRSLVAIGIAWNEAQIPEAGGFEPATHDFVLHAIATPTGWVPKAPL